MITLSLPNQIVSDSDEQARQHKLIAEDIQEAIEQGKIGQHYSLSLDVVSIASSADAVTIEIHESHCPDDHERWSGENELTGEIRSYILDQRELVLPFRSITIRDRDLEYDVSITGSES